jgi:uncharacterized protein (TIGR03067 family)
MPLARGSMIAVAILLLWSSQLPADEAADEAEREKLIGVWQGFVVEGRGENPDRGVVKLTLTIKEGQMTATGKDGVEDLGEGTYEVNFASDPRGLDATRKKPNGRGETHEGIYALDGDILKWCVTNGRSKRPEEFVTKPGAGQFLLVLRRQAAKAEK